MTTEAIHGPHSAPRRILHISLDLPSISQSHSKIRGIEFASLTQKGLEEFAPDLVVFQLFSGNFDAAMILETLASFGYSGEAHVLAPKLPKPKLVETELRGLAENIRTKLITAG